MSKSAKVDESQAADVVLGYMTSACRPYSAGDIHNNLQKDFGLGKACVQRVLDALVQEGTLREKVYGKQKIYFVDQSKTTPVNSQEMVAMDEELATLTGEWQQLSEDVRRLESQASGLGNEKPLDELRRDCRSLEKECQELEEKLASLKEGSRGVDPVENKKVRDKRALHVKEWGKRKRLSNSCLDAILEGYPKPKKALLEELGLETDEDNDAVLPKA